MLGKRKRGHAPSKEQIKSPHISPHTPSLTHENLETFDAHIAAEVASITKNYPAPFDVMPYQSPSTQKKTVSEKTKNTSLTNLERILNLYRFYLNRKKPMPSELEDLLADVLVPRECDITPNSKNVKIAKEQNEGLSEDMEIHVLVDKLIYRPRWYGENDLDGEPLISQGRNDLWADLIPRPPDALPNTNLAAAMNQLGLPTRPKPDFSFGYGDDAFPGDLKAGIDSLPPNLLLFHKKPWFPYKVVQWKSASGTIREAEQQIKRDTSAAIDTIYRFFKLAYPKQEPSPEHICVFSLIVYARNCEYRIHWRRVDCDGTISYEGDIVSRAYLDDEAEIFKLRGVMLKTLEWARGPRLTAIKNALEALRSGSAVQQASPPTTDAIPYNVPHAANPQTTPQQDLAQTQHPQVDTPAHSSIQTPQSRGSRSRPEKRRRVGVDIDSDSDDTDPLQ
ncbi:MAG: hypothetical protein Q9208_003898 [Pyrenodesmia sp. 3 TL-2023]